MNVLEDIGAAVEAGKKLSVVEQQRLWAEIGSLRADIASLQAHCEAQECIRDALVDALQAIHRAFDHVCETRVQGAAHFKAAAALRLASTPPEVLAMKVRL